MAFWVTSKLIPLIPSVTSHLFWWNIFFWPLLFLGKISFFKSIIKSCDKQKYEHLFWFLFSGSKNCCAYNLAVPSNHLFCNKNASTIPTHGYVCQKFLLMAKMWNTYEFYLYSITSLLLYYVYQPHDYKNNEKRKDESIQTDFTFWFIPLNAYFDIYIFSTLTHSYKYILWKLKIIRYGSFC